MALGGSQPNWPNMLLTWRERHWPGPTLHDGKEGAHCSWVLLRLELPATLKSIPTLLVSWTRANLAQIVCSGRRAEKQPSTLQILHCWDLLKKGGMGLGNFPQLFHHKLWLPQRGSEHANSLLVDWKVCTPSPHDGVWIRRLCCSDEWLTTQGEDSSTIPQLCLPQIHPNPRVLPQFVLEQSINGGHSVWSAHNIDVIQECQQPLTGAQFLRNCIQRTLCCPNENRAGINASPCSPPSPWEMS